MRTPQNLQTLADLREALNRGEARVAERGGDDWHVNLWVRKGILLHAHMGVMESVGPEGRSAAFELDTFPVRKFEKQDLVRIPPGGNWIRDGAFIAQGVTCMPPR